MVENTRDLITRWVQKKMPHHQELVLDEITCYPSICTEYTDSAMAVMISYYHGEGGLVEYIMEESEVLEFFNALWNNELL